MGKWSRFRVDTDNGFIKAITDANNRGELEPMATAPLNPSYTVPAIIANKQYTIGVPGTYVNLRAAPLATATDIGDVHKGSVVTALEQMVAGGEYWTKITTSDGKSGWVSRQLGKVTLTEVVTVPPPVVVDPPPVVIPDTPPADTVQSYTISLVIKSPELDDSKIAAIQNGVKILITALSWIGQGVGNSEVEVKVSKAA